MRESDCGYLSFAQTNDGLHWPTVQVDDAKNISGRDKETPYLSLVRAVRKYPTIRASEYKGTGPLGSKSSIYRLNRKYLDATIQDMEQSNDPLNPDWCAWLMGWPKGWESDDSLSEKQELNTTTFWDVDPADRNKEDNDYIPRVSNKLPVSIRRKRLFALGNGWVPQTAAIVLNALKTALKQSAQSN